MIRTLGLTLLCLFAGTLTCHAAETPGMEGADRTILVTFSDPGMGKSAPAGSSRPGYQRRSTAYLVSVGVKRAATRIAEEFDLVTLDDWPIRSLKLHCLLFSVPDAGRVEDLLRQLRQRPEVESAQRLNEFEVDASEVAGDADPYAGLQHHLKELGLEQAHRWSQGEGVEVSIIDTGADIEHPELRAPIRTHRDFVAGSDNFQADAHGTAVAGVIAAESGNGIGIVGMAPAAHLSVLKACWHRPDQGARALCNSFTLAKALDFAIQSKTDIINLSLGGPSDALLGRLVELALSYGTIVVAAAPDGGLAGFPSEIEGVIVVDASDRIEIESGRQRSTVRAPGVDILVPVPRGGFDFASGSSLSAAHVTGIVALLVARQHDLTPEQVATLLRQSQSGRDQSANACRALAELLGESGCNDTGGVSS